MKSPTSPRATYQDVLDAPRHKVAQIIGGKLYTHSRPNMPHALAISRLGIRIGSPFDIDHSGPGGWWIVVEPELHLGKDILVPDLAGWRRERMPEYPNSAYCTVTPDWVCEVLSRSTKKLDLGDKQVMYAREGVGYRWYIDPDARSLEAFQLRSTEWVLIDTLIDDAKVSLPPFEAISFNLSDLWPPHVLQKTVPEEDAAELVQTAR